MTPFLKQVARHYMDTPDIGSRLFIFPNKRPMAFFRKYLSESLAETPGSAPVLSPQLFTVNEFFSRVTGMAVADKITLLVTLYECYSSLNPDAGALDDFLSQGETILSDFDEVDKYKVDPKMIFTDIENIRAVGNDMSWVSEEQKKAIVALAGHFTAEKLTSKENVKGRFLATWKLLLPMYELLRVKLSAQGLAYEGMAYRSFADRVEKEPVAEILANAFPGVSKFVFVGFNAVNRCEETVMTKMQKAGIAEFCWDYCGKMTTDDDNDSSFFLKDYSSRFKSAFEVEGGGVPEIRVVSVPSSAGQAELIEKIIGECRSEGDADWLDYAIVLPDETMLGSVLNNIPSTVGPVNVTMGYPLSSSEFFYFLRSLISLQLRVRNSGGKYSFYYRQVYDLFSGTILKSVMCKEENKVVAEVRKAAKPYIPVTDLASTPLFSSVFRAAAADGGDSGIESSAALAEYLLEAIASVARALPEEDALQTECAKMCYKCISRLKEMRLDVQPRTFAKLLLKLASGLSVPFEGEPLGGLQIMGPLETRALDFKHVVILSASEGVFPRINSGLSMIPMDVRLGFGLPTTRYQDAVWSYYFYRLITRAESVTMLYDSRTEGLTSGEESRYVKQLRYIYSRRGLCKLKEVVAAAKISTAPLMESIPKTQEDIDIIRNTELSASTLHSYLECPKKFYYQVVKGLRIEDEVNDSLDAGTLGTVCHDTLEALYCGPEAMADRGDFDKRYSSWEDKPHLNEITEKYLASWLTKEGQAAVKDKIYSLICSKLHCDEVTGPDLLDARLALQYVTQVIRRDIELIRERGPITIIGLEKKYKQVELYDGFKFKGYIDRLDSFADGSVRVVDYKTGSDDPEKLKLLAGTQEIKGTLDKIDKAVVQFYLYDKFVKSDPDFAGITLTNSMYAMGDIFRNKVAVTKVAPAPAKTLDGMVEATLAEMVSPDVDFIKPKNCPVCRYCDYCSLCGEKNRD